MSELKELEIRYSKNYQTTFEDLCTLLFCTNLGLTEGVNRRQNQRGIESEPVKIGTKKYAYQAKYYEASTKLSARKQDIINCIREASKENITDLYLYINKNKPDRSSATNVEPKYIQEIESIARRNNITLHWWTLSKIESSLDMPKFDYIKKKFFNEHASDSYFDFYKYIYDQYSHNSESELYGGMSMQECYIEPFIKIFGINSTHISSVKQYLEKWVNGNETITVICGEPGHGKTSLCHKAMCDFYKNGWLLGKVSNTFCFSLNPANTNALSNNSLYLYDLLSWGDDRKEHRIKKENCRNALIFFDGFDELLEWYPKLNINSFINDFIVPFQKDTSAHIVITTRTMAIEPIHNNHRVLSNGISFFIHKLMPISHYQQLSWIKLYTEHCKLYSPENVIDLMDYYEQYENMIQIQASKDESIDSILGIPIIFRMIVINRYIPSISQSVTEIYERLFDITWSRHRRIDETQKSTVKSSLMNHALNIFIDNNDTAEIVQTDNFSESYWLFSFYTTHAGGRRIGFLHRSFYQYFLAHKILSWYENVTVEKLYDFKKNSYFLSRRRLDKTTLSYIHEIYSKKKEKTHESFDVAFTISYKVLKETDGILSLPDTPIQGNLSYSFGNMQTTSPLERSNYYYWNIVSVGSICGHTITYKDINEKSLQLYDLSGSKLVNAQLTGANLERARLFTTNLHGADLYHANLHKADLKEAILTQANLSAANFSEADLIEANLERANLSDAELLNTNLERCNLDKAVLVGADLERANLRDAKLQNANLEEADLYLADLCGANLRGANLKKANLIEANLVNADFSGADLRGAVLTGANIVLARLDGAILTNAQIDYKRARYLSKRGYDSSDMFIINSLQE